MTKPVHSYVALLGVSTLLSAFSLASIIAFTDPAESSWVTFLFFYLSLFLVTLGIFTGAGLFLRNRFLHGLYAVNLNISFRQAFLVSILVVASLALQAQGILFWWVEMTIILLLGSIEVFLNLKV